MMLNIIHNFIHKMRMKHWTGLGPFYNHLQSQCNHLGTTDLHIGSIESVVHQSRSSHGKGHGDHVDGGYWSSGSCTGTGQTARPHCLPVSKQWNSITTKSPFMAKKIKEGEGEYCPGSP